MNDQQVKYPEIEVQLTGEDGNACAILGRVGRALRRAGHGTEVIAEFQKEATTGDYDHLLGVCCKWVTVL